jgi:hypothetical protein
MMDLISPFLTLNTAFFVGECVLTMSFMMSSLLLVRICAMLSQIIIIVASSLVGFDQVGMLSYFIFSSLSLVINATHIYRLLYSRLPASVGEKHKSMHELNFSTLSPKEFLILLGFGKHSIKKDEVIIAEREPCDVHLNLNGNLQILIDDKVIASLPSNSLVGEISFLTSKPSIACVKALGEVELYSWDRASLLKIQKKYPTIYFKVYEILLNNVVDKLALANKAIHLGVLNKPAVD